GEACASETIPVRRNIDSPMTATSRTAAPNEGRAVPKSPREGLALADSDFSPPSQGGAGGVTDTDRPKPPGSSALARCTDSCLIAKIRFVTSPSPPLRRGGENSAPFLSNLVLLQLCARPLSRSRPRAR